MEIRHIAVLGSGVMGSGIAAHAANAGLQVTLLDIVPKGAENRNTLAEKAVERMLGSSPSPFFSAERAKNIACGNMEDDLERLKTADWIIEAVIERKDIKQDVYKKVDRLRKKGSVLSSNTSTIPLHELLADLPSHIAQDFMIAHFFNPPRFMRLLEVVKSPAMADDTFSRICDFADVHLGKEIVPCKDTPGFIANRIGVFWMMAGFNAAIRHRISIEDADAVMGKPVGIPKTGVFGLFDLIGLDVIQLIVKEMLATLPAQDAFFTLDAEPELLKKCIADGYMGRKAKGGFTRMRKEGEKKIRESLDLQSGEYRPERKSSLASAKARSVKELLEVNDAGSAYAWEVLCKTLTYAASLIPEISDDIAGVDAAMKSGYSWKYGPFELIDQIGVDAFVARARKDGHAIAPLLRKAAGKTLYRLEKQPSQFNIGGTYIPLPHAQGVLTLADVKRETAPVFSNASAGLWDLSNGIACFSLTTKMNAWDADAFTALESSLAKVKADFDGMIIGTDAELFSAGANLEYFLKFAQKGDFAAIEAFLLRGQSMFMQMKYAPFPTVAALCGLALGGGCETTLHCANVQAHAESYPGLVEVNVGLIPAWGGCKEMLLRLSSASASFQTILSATKASSYDHAVELGYLRKTDPLTMNRARLLADAKANCLRLAQHYTPPTPAMIAPAPDVANTLAGIAARQGLPAHTKTIGAVLAAVLSVSGTEQAVLDAERAGFIELIKTKPSQDRIEHMLNTGKPLAN